LVLFFLSLLGLLVHPTQANGACGLRPYALTVEHLSTGERHSQRNVGGIPGVTNKEEDGRPRTNNRTLVVIDPDPDGQSPRFSWKARSVVTPAPEASASRVQVIRRRNSLLADDSAVTNSIVWDSGWLCLGRRNGLDVFRAEGQLPGLVEGEILYWRASFAILTTNAHPNHNDGSRNGTMNDTEPFPTTMTSGNKTTSTSSRTGARKNPGDELLSACEWSDYESFTVGLSQETWAMADWLCAGATISNDNVNIEDDKSFLEQDCDSYDTTGKAAAPLFRTIFDLPAAAVVQRATLFVTGLGHYEAWMNGIQINSGRYLDPAPASYDKRVYYNAFDVTRLLFVPEIAGERRQLQVLGLLAGNGWFNPLPLRMFGRFNLRDALPVGSPRVRCILQVTFATRADGTSPPPLLLPSQAASWQTTSSSLFRNDLYLGNVVDLDRQQALKGWSATTSQLLKPGDYSERIPTVIIWEPCKRCADSPNVSQWLQPQPIPPIRARPPYQLHPISRYLTEEGALVLDMGLNTAAVIQVDIVVPRNAWLTNGGNHKNSNIPSNASSTIREIEFRFGEVLWPNGTVNGRTAVAGQIKYGNGGPCAPSVAYQSLVLRGTEQSFAIGLYNFTTQFSWAGFRYIQIMSGTGGGVSWLDSDAAEQPSLKVRAIPIMTDLEWTSSFQSSNSLLNNIYDMCVNTHASNMLGIQSDCPHRERFGYTGDALATLPSSLLLFDGAAFYEKRLYDTHDAQRPNGGITETAPNVGISGGGMGDGSGPIGWATLFTELQVQLYRYFANTRAIQHLQNSTRHWIEFLEATDNDEEGGGVIDSGLGDWMAVDPTPTPITGRGFLIANLRAWSWLAQSSTEGARARKKAFAATKSFNDRFVNRTTGEVKWNGSTPTQTAQAMTLFHRLLMSPASSSTTIDKVRSSFLETITRRGSHLSTGMFGTLWLFDTLEALNRSDIAWDVISQTDYPSYGYMLREGATTLWESWFYSNDTFSHNHPMFSGAIPWILGSIGGIRVDTAHSIGGDRLLFAPTRPPGSNLTHATATVVTARGTAISSWTCLPPGVMHVNITCLVNTRGTVVFHGTTRPPLEIGGGSYNFVFSTTQCSLGATMT
jgi:alpha-L-rhamnosidase